MKRTARLALLGLLGSAVLASSGCGFWLVATDLRTGERFQQTSLDAIGSGTPVGEVLDRLGPPAAVARQGTVVQLPLYPGRKEGSREIASDVLFARFPAPGPPGPRDTVFVYEAPSFERSGSYLFVWVVRDAGPAAISASRDRLRTERLLLLVDGELRVVRGMLYEVEETTQRPPAAEATRVRAARSQARDGGKEGPP